MDDGLIVEKWRQERVRRAAKSVCLSGAIFIAASGSNWEDLMNDDDEKCFVRTQEQLSFKQS